MRHTLQACKLLPITLALIGHNDLVRLGLQEAIGAAPHLRLVGHANSSAAAGALLADTKPQVVLIETDSAEDVAEWVRLVKETVAGSKIVALCGLEASSQLQNPILSSVDAVVLTVQPTIVLIATIESLCQPTVSHKGSGDDGQTEPMTNGSIALIDAAVGPEGKWPATLTDRERQVVSAVGQGLSNRGIASLLCISDITVRHHLTSIFDKLGIHGRQKLLVYVHRRGFLALSARDEIHSSS